MLSTTTPTLLGRGRQRDGIPLPPHVRAKLWTARCAHVGDPEPHVFFDLWRDEDGQHFAVTEHSAHHPVSEDDVREIAAWLRAEGFRTYALPCPRFPARTLRLPPDPAPRERDDHGNPTRSGLSCVTSPGREKRLRRQLAGGEKRRSKERSRARRFWDDE